MGTKIIETGSTAGSIAKVEYKDELGNVLFSFDDSNSVLGNILTTSGAAGKLLKTGTAGNIGVGIGATEVSGYLIKSYSPSSASLQKFSNSATGQTATDGWAYRDWETDRKSTRLNSSHSAKSRMPSSA